MPRLLASVIALLASFAGYSQCFQKPVPLAERVNEATLVVEGSMDSSYCAWNSDHTFILTIHQFTIYKYFKGTSAANVIDVVTVGGTIDNQMLVVEPQLELKKGSKGIILLKENTYAMSSLAGSASYVPVAAEQGFIEYDLIAKSAQGPFDKFGNIIAELYPSLVNATGRNFTNIHPFKAETYGPDGQKIFYRTTATPTITNFSPTTTTAGTNSVLTINGTNFGASYSGSANVEFKNANNGGSGYLSTPANSIVSWSDVQIQVKVPTGAGTGTIRVTNPTAEVVTSASNVTITYNQSNVTYLSNDYEPNLLNLNGAGGYTYIYSTATANSGVSFAGHANATSLFATALSTWNCNTGFNVLINTGSTTTIGATANDGVFVAMFDNSATPLGSGVLGTAYSWYNGCSVGPNFYWYVNDIDIIFKRDGTDGITWYFGNPASQPAGTSDFGSVALHELGHNHQLGHVISPGAVMNYSITTGTNNRNLNPAQDIAAGLYVMGHSNTFAQCGKSGMTNFSCTSPPVADFSGTPLTACTPPASINFTDLSSNAPTSWSWTFTGGSPSSSTARNPSNIVYNTSGTYTVSLTATNANGSNSITKTAYISVGGASLPVTTDFEGTFAPTGFTVINPDAFASQPGFVQSGSITGISGAATKAAYMRNFSYGYVATDGLQTMKYDLTGATAPNLKFDLAYRRWGSGNYETLEIYISTDCGSTFPTRIYRKSGSDADIAGVTNSLITTSPASSSTEFFPSSATQWRTETVDLSAYIGNVIMLRFDDINGLGNNLYIDNINVNANALPLVLESFNAARTGSSVKLSWKTTEIDHAEIYKIEKSADGVNFTELLSVNSVKGMNLYEKFDYAPGNGMVYYRLRQEQEDAKLSYSPVVAVDMSSSMPSAELIFFPNPVGSGEIFSFESQEEEMGDLKLFDLSGRSVGNMEYTKRGSFIEVSAQVSAGVYILEYNSGGLLRKGKIMVK